MRRAITGGNQASTLLSTSTARLCNRKVVVARHFTSRVSFIIRDWVSRKTFSMQLENTTKRKLKVMISL